AAGSSLSQVNARARVGDVGARVNMRAVSDIGPEATDEWRQAGFGSLRGGLARRVQPGAACGEPDRRGADAERERGGGRAPDGEGAAGLQAHSSQPADAAGKRSDGGQGRARRNVVLRSPAVGES